MATDTKSGGLKLKAGGGGSAAASSSKPKVDSSPLSSSSLVKKKSVEITPKLSAGAKGKALTKTEVKVNAKVTPSSSKTITRTREKKVYSLPGQKFDIPEEREPLRLFYESLSRQIPSSEMAEFWLMEHGLLSPERAKRHLRRNRGSKAT